MIILAVIWIVWCFLHSLLISSFAHNAAKKILGSHFSLYRLLYVGFSCISLIPVLWYQFSLPRQVLVPGNWFIWTCQAILVLYGCFMFYAGARVYDMGYFLGLSQWRNHRLNRKKKNLPFHTDGILAYVRHPWYSGGIAIIWGVGPCTDIYVVSRSALTAYFIVGTLLEESRLKEELGEKYTEYSRKVPMLFPWKKPLQAMFGDMGK